MRSPSVEVHGAIRTCALAAFTLGTLAVAACGAAPHGEAAVVRAFSGATVVDGTGSPPIQNAVLLVRDGRIEAAGPSTEISVPTGSEVVDLRGRWVVPGLINSHGHVGGTRGLESGAEHYNRDNILDQLALYARYGVTTVLSLGGDGEEGVRVRDEQNSARLDRARLHVAGPVLTPETPGEAREQVRRAAAMNVDWIKIRVDDALGTTEKMPEPVYRAVIDEANALQLPVAAHVVYLEDAHGLVDAGVTLLAHSVRDRVVDARLIDALRARSVCLSPTLTREVSTFVYRERPDFFDDPFFLRDADSVVLRGLEQPERQRAVRDNRAARFWEAALPTAQRNLEMLADSGVGIAFGTDSGPVARFQGYFEHLELWMMADAGLAPAQVLHSATGMAARCLRLDEELGTLQPGRWADFVVLAADPLADIRNTRSLESVWIAGNQVPSASH